MSLLEKDPKAPKSWLGTLPVTSRYTYGLAGERFFRALKDEGRIYGTRCSRCNHLYVPAVSFCERCLGELDEWIDVGLIGEVHTYTLLYQNYDGTPRQSPELIAFVRMGDGGIVHRLAEVSPDNLKIGMRVMAVLKSQEERKGSIQDILYFKPA